jgi:hypothetical protein
MRRGLWGRLLGQEGSIANAGSACQELSARQVERVEVETFLREHLADRGNRPVTA